MGGGAGRPGESFENDTHACAREVQCSAVQSIGERERERSVHSSQMVAAVARSTVRGEERRGAAVRSI